MGWNPRPSTRLCLIIPSECAEPSCPNLGLDVLKIRDRVVLVQISLVRVLWSKLSLIGPSCP